MRPPGEISQAVRAAWAEAASKASRPVLATSRDVASWLVPKGVGRKAVAHTVKNMARAGPLRPAGTVKVAGSCRPLVTYAPAWGDAPAPDPLAELASVTRSWRSAAA